MIDLDVVAQKVRSIEIACNIPVESTLKGLYHSCFKGSGSDWTGLRPYVDGEDSSSIDWTATARSNEAIVKTYDEERSVDVVFILDCSLSMMCSSRLISKFDILLESFALLALSAVRNNDAVYPYMFADSCKAGMCAGRTVKGVLASLAECIEFQERCRESAKTSIDSVLQMVVKKHRKPSVIFLLSDFCFQDGYQARIRKLGARHDLISINVNDQLEEKCDQSFVCADPESMQAYASGEKSGEFVSRSRIEITTTDCAADKIIAFFESRRWRV